MKMVKSVFFDENSRGGEGGQDKILRQDKVNFCTSPPTRGNPKYCGSIFADIVATLMITSTCK